MRGTAGVEFYVNGGCMPDIRYICLSDLHFGADNSLLTHLRPGTSEVDPTQPSPVLVKLAPCLESLAALNGGRSKPTLVLNGDVLELALALDNKAVMAFERFLELLIPPNGPPLIDSKIIFIPGNHDHHLWETARETQYVEFIQRKPPDAFLDVPWHTTKMFEPDLVPATLLNGVIRRYRHMVDQGVSVGTVYPNLCVLSRDETRCAIFTHGHFIESIYTLMSRIRTFLSPESDKPTQVWDIEEENFAWIDFFWSAMGRSGEVGEEVERIYDMLLVPSMRKKLAAQLARAIGRTWMPHVPSVGAALGSLLLKRVILFFLGRAGGLEKTSGNEPLSDDASAGLASYLQVPVRNQLMLERNGTLPVQATIIFGHTHKPFAATRNFKHFPERASIFNTGGWVVDTPAVEPSHGASIVVVDDDLNTAALRVYNEAADPQAYAVKLDAVDSDPAANPLCGQLNTVLTSCQKHWEALSAVIAENVNTYHQNFGNRLNAIRQKS